MSKILCITSIPDLETKATWILDLGAKDHMTPVPDIFISSKPCGKSKDITWHVSSEKTQLINRNKGVYVFI